MFEAAFVIFLESLLLFVAVSVARSGEKRQFCKGEDEHIVPFKVFHSAFIITFHLCSGTPRGPFPPQSFLIYIMIHS